MISAEIKKALDEVKLTPSSPKSLKTRKEQIKKAISLWLQENEIKAFPYLEVGSFYSKPKDWAFGIHNSKGSISASRSKWLNKIIVSRYYDGSDWYVRSHKATTDEKFLSPTDKNFLEFIKEIINYLYE